MRQCTCAPPRKLYVMRTRIIGMGYDMCIPITGTVQHHSGVCIQRHFAMQVVDNSAHVIIDNLQEQDLL